MENALKSELVDADLLAHLILSAVTSMVANREEEPMGLPLSFELSEKLMVRAPDVFSGTREGDGKPKVVSLKPPEVKRGIICMSVFLEARKHPHYNQAKSYGYDSGYRLDIAADWRMSNDMGTSDRIREFGIENYNPLLDNAMLGLMEAQAFHIVLMPHEMACASRVEAVSEIT